MLMISDDVFWKTGGTAHGFGAPQVLRNPTMAFWFMVLGWPLKKPVRSKYFKPECEFNHGHWLTWICCAILQKRSLHAVHMCKPCRAKLPEMLKPNFWDWHVIVLSLTAADWGFISGPNDLSGMAVFDPWDGHVERKGLEHEKSGCSLQHEASWEQGLIADIS